MNKFELYHPIFTDHFALDWLTHSKVLDIYKLRHDTEIAKHSGREIDATIEDTTTYVNQMMRLIMNNKALIWGISTKVEREFLGTFCIWDFDSSTGTASIRFEILRDQQRKGIMQEVLTRMTVFSFEELGLKQLRATVLKENSATCALLDRAGFSIDSSIVNDQTVTFELNHH
jgi:ribosomal-protein-alanine N-acetyltransferase